MAQVPMFRATSPLLPLVLLILLALGVALAWFWQKQTAGGVGPSPLGPHSSTATPGPAWQPMLARLDAFQRASLGEATRWRVPLGTESGGFSYNAQPFASPNPRRGGGHTGDDLNGIGGENTDFGDPLFAPADGLVVSVNEPSPGWGRVVVLAHRVDGRLITSQLAHLSEVLVRPGDFVEIGQLLGRVGTSSVSDFAHLHWEWREGAGLSTVEGGYDPRPPQTWAQRPAEAEVLRRQR